MRRLIWLLVGLVFVVALGSGIGWLFAGDMVYVPRFAEQDPKTVVTAYFDAQSWGLDSYAHQIEAPAIAAMREAADPQSPVPDDLLFARNLTVGDAEQLAPSPGYSETVRFLVSYTSRFEGADGRSPGARLWWAYLGLDDGGRWRIIGMTPAQ